MMVHTLERVGIPIRPLPRFFFFPLKFGNLAFLLSGDLIPFVFD